VHRDLADAIKRADVAETRLTEGTASVKGIEQRALDAEAKAAEIQQELGDQLARPRRR